MRRIVAASAISLSGVSLPESSSSSELSLDFNGGRPAYRVGALAATVRGAAIDAAPRGNVARRLTELKTSKFL
jgi:hypothetical protein